MSRSWCCFHIGGRACAVDVAHTQEVVRHAEWTPVPLGPPELAGLTGLRGGVLAVWDLRDAVGGVPAARPVRAGRLLVLSGAAAGHALFVDQVDEVRELDPTRARAAPGPFVQSIWRRGTEELRLLDPAGFGPAARPADG